MKNGLLALVVGYVFAVGLAVAGMTQPAKVKGFLDFTGEWDPSLALVMGTAVPVYMIAYRVVLKMKAPLLGGRFNLPSRKDLDGRLIGGAILFGAGWGLGGFCPGPAIASLVTGATSVLLFVMAMLLGMVLFRTWDEFSSRSH